MLKSVFLTVILFFAMTLLIAEATFSSPLPQGTPLTAEATVNSPQPQEPESLEAAKDKAKVDVPENQSQTDDGSKSELNRSDEKASKTSPSTPRPVRNPYDTVKKKYSTIQCC